MRGSHRKFVRGERTVIVSGSPGDDAKRYQERAVAQAVSPAASEGPEGEG